MSRSFGDFIYKQNNSLSAVAQPVSCEPDIRVIAREPTDNYLIFACDGIWDVFSPDDLIRVLNDLLVYVWVTWHWRRVMKRPRKQYVSCWICVWSEAARTTWHLCWSCWTMRRSRIVFFGWALDQMRKRSNCEKRTKKNWLQLSSSNNSRRPQRNCSHLGWIACLFDIPFFGGKYNFELDSILYVRDAWHKSGCAKKAKRDTYHS